MVYAKALEPGSGVGLFCKEKHKIGIKNGNRNFL